MIDVPRTIEPVFLKGDTLDVLRQIPAKSVQCTVTSPPYWGLRDYSACDCSTVRVGVYLDSPGQMQHVRNGVPDPDCGYCHGTGSIALVKERQYGLEPTMQEWLRRQVEVFREVRRVTRDDGCLWLNLGDKFDDDRQLMGQPWRLAFALQEDGWILRRDVIWWSRNSQPEAAKDRPTTAHEYVFLFYKNGSHYYDRFGQMQPYSEATMNEMDEEYTGGPSKNYEGAMAEDPSEVKRSVIAGLRNKPGAYMRSVWDIPAQPHNGPHLTTFADELVARCIRLGTSSAGACGKCGVPYVHVVKASGGLIGRAHVKTNVRGVDTEQAKVYWKESDPTDDPYTREDLGFSPACSCGAAPVPCVVLDPYSGSGTTMKVARTLGRASVGIDINPRYVDFQQDTPELMVASLDGEW